MKPPRGARWERLAESFLRDRGLSTVARNAHSRVGELDLVMRDGEAVVFIEVRYRERLNFGTGADSVTAGKRRRLWRAAAMFLAQHPALARQPCRFDVMSISQGPDGPSMDWIRNAFDAPPGRTA